ncbi:hypothetical protein A0H81_10402 [Grifola frondosa]|uniref:Uncharacterized protein n=1 Tax=Grifola frondosa TaxID=5627 RepID=A0A1C7LYB1_GRIFR|nr:hypothetical protein A0H81_10402 [Grifola frondosa]
MSWCPGDLLPSESMPERTSDVSNPRVELWLEDEDIPMPSQIKGSTHKNTLEIRLTESVVFLRAGDATGRHRTIQHGYRALRSTLSERQLQLGQKGLSYVFFRASSASASNTRRTLSVGPGLALDHDDEDHSEQSSIAHQDIRLDGPPIETPRINRRHMSVDQTHYHRSFVSHVESTTQEPLTPPYSPEPGPSTSVMQRSSMGTMNESPAQSLEDFRRTFRTGLETEQSTRGRSHSRPSGSSSWRAGAEGDVTPPRGRTRDRSPGSLRRTMDPGKEREYMPQHQKELSTLERMGEALGFEVDEGREYGDGWKEFRKGVYTYPISFAIPASSPPSLSVVTVLCCGG